VRPHAANPTPADELKILRPWNHSRVSSMVARELIGEGFAMDVLHDACPFAAANFTDFIARERIGELMLRPASRLCSDFPIGDRWRISLPALINPLT